MSGLFDEKKMMREDYEMKIGAKRLRRCRPADAEPVYEAVHESMTELTPWMPWCHPRYSLDDSRAWFDSRTKVWRKGREFDFLIVDDDTDFPLGTCGLNHINAEDKYANLGYWVRTSKTGQGIATTVVPMIARFGFETLRLNRIEILAATGNLASQRVAEKIGAKREGLLRRRLVVGKEVLDAYLFSLIPNDLA